MTPVTDLHILTGLGTGGTETALARYLAASPRAAAAAVLALSGDGPMRPALEDTGAAVHVLGMAPGRPDPLSVLRFVRLVRRLDPAVLSGWLYHGALAATLAQSVLSGRRPMIWQMRQGLYDRRVEKRHTQWTLRALAALSRRPCAILYNSLIARDQHEAAGVCADHAAYLPNGIDTALFHPAPEAVPTLRHELGLPPDRLVVGQVGRLHPHKDHETALRAFAQASDTAHLALVGEVPDDRRPVMETLIADLGIGPRVHLLGLRRDVHRLLPAFDVVINSSYTEASPNCLTEALACGVPAVATDVGDSARLIGPAGRVVPARDPAALAAALRAILALPAEDRLSLGATGRAYVSATYSLTAMVTALDDRLAALAADGSATA